MSVEEKIEYDQDTAPQPMPGSPEAVQAAAVEKEIEFDPEHPESLRNLDIGTATEDFSPELRELMDKPMGNLGGDQPDEPPEDVVEILVPKSEPKVWIIGPEPGMELVQRPMSFIGKMQWFALVGEMLDKAMTGENPLSLADLLDDTGKTPTVSMSNLKEADTFVRAVGKLVMYAPSFLIDSFTIWLSVPNDDRRLFRDIVNLPESEGGLTDEQGMEIIEIFIDQNWDALTSFFSERIGGIQKRIASKQELRRRA